MVTDFRIVSDAIEDQVYTLDEPAVQLGSYEFTRSPTCDYEETLEVLGLPTSGVVVHDSVQRTLTLAQTNDPNDLGTYPIIIRSSFDQLQSDGSLQKQSKEITFTLEI